MKTRYSIYSTSRDTNTILIDDVIGFVEPNCVVSTTKITFCDMQQKKKEEELRRPLPIFFHFLDLKAAFFARISTQQSCKQRLEERLKTNKKKKEYRGLRSIFLEKRGHST